MNTAIDLFAGSGGFTVGAEQAGLQVVWAANHNPVAVNCHKQNHPHTQHICQDLHQANWTKVPKADIVLASPCCQGHTRARGKDRPQHDDSRSTAWAVVSCCEMHRPGTFVVENVPEFQTWVLFPQWRASMEALGYHITLNILDAADTGLPQNRVRLFVVGNLSKSMTISRPQQAHTPVSSILDFESGKWSKVNKPGRSPATLSRVKNGRRELGKRFVMSYYGTSKTGRSLDRPVGTIMCKDRWAVVDGPWMRMFTIEEYRKAMGFPEGYWLPKQRHPSIQLLGNAVPPPLSRHVLADLRRRLAA